MALLTITRNGSYIFIKTQKNMNKLYKLKLEIMVSRSLHSLMKSRKIRLY